MSDLTAFLSARLDEAEAAANEIHRPCVCGSVDRDGEFDPDPIWCSCDYPARVLRDVKAKRKILAEYKPAARFDGPGEPEYAYGWAEGLGMAVRALAAVYSDHEDYRPEWQPEGDHP